jgi:hypothetical protein
MIENVNHRFKRTTSVLLLSAAAVGCASEPSEAPIATLAASEPSRDIGVASWQVYKEDDAVRIVGLDAEQRRQAEMVVAQADAERVHVQLAFPEQRDFEFAKGGAIEGDTSPFVEGLRAAMTADLSERTISLATNPDNALGTAESNLYLQGEGHIPLGWSFFGYRADITVNGWCGQGIRYSYDAYSNSGASCWIWNWTSQSAYDCRVQLHYGISGWRTDTCNWFVYSNPL